MSMASVKQEKNFRPSVLPTMCCVIQIAVARTTGVTR